MSLILIMVAGCGNSYDVKNEDVNESESNNVSTEEAEDQVLNIGETGLKSTTVTDYEITPMKVETFKEIDGEEPFEAENIFTIIDFKLKNTGVEAVESTDIIGMGVVLEGDKFTSDNKWGEDYDFLDGMEIEVEIEPNEEVEGTLVFETEESSSYELHDGWGLETVSNLIIWEINESDIN